MTACAGAFMVSRFSYYSFKQVNLVGPVRFATFLIVPLIFIAIAVYPPVALLALFGGYALWGALHGIYRRLRRAQRPVAPSGNPPV